MAYTPYLGDDDRDREYDEGLEAGREARRSGKPYLGGEWNEELDKVFRQGYKDGWAIEDQELRLD